MAPWRVPCGGRAPGGPRPGRTSRLPWTRGRGCRGRIDQPPACGASGAGVGTVGGGADGPRRHCGVMEPPPRLAVSGSGHVARHPSPLDGGDGLLAAVGGDGPGPGHHDGGLSVRDPGARVGQRAHPRACGEPGVRRAQWPRGRRGGGGTATLRWFTPWAISRCPRCTSPVRPRRRFACGSLMRCLPACWPRCTSHDCICLRQRAA